MPVQPANATRPLTPPVSEISSVTRLPAASPYVASAFETMIPAIPVFSALLDVLVSPAKFAARTF